MSAAHYFATIPFSIEPLTEISIFLFMNGDVVAAQSGVLHSDLIHVVMHPESRRRAADAPALLPGHALELLAPKEDWFVDDEGRTVVESCHKLGGRPFLISEDAAIARALTEISEGGFRQVLQFDFPAGGDDAAIDGPWPFVDGMFHLFGRQQGAAWEWRWFWDL